MTRVAIFDLDGTLLNTLDDLHAAVNRALLRGGFPTRTREQIRAFVGDGVETLLRRALPAGTDSTPAGKATAEACLADFKADYAAACAVRTAPYTGVLEMLDGLLSAGVRIAVVSNKFDAATRQLCAAYFGARVEVAIGEREADGVRKKPHPDTVFEALRALGMSTERDLSEGCVRAVYIGDSEVDIATAKNAGLSCISVTWGFRDADFLRAHGAAVLAERPSDILRLILSD